MRTDAAPTGRFEPDDRFPAALALIGALSFGLIFAPCSGAASAPFYAPAAVEARVSFGHDSNLLDASDLERATFERGDQAAFFVVDRMSDQFCEGEVELEWKTPRPLAGRPSLRFGWERRQYLHNPVKSEDRLAMGLRLRPADGTRVDLEGTLRPQTYVRHRLDLAALPGQPQFRPEAYRRWDLELKARQALGVGTTFEGSIEGSTRRYRAPFEERDRKSFGGGGGVARALGARLDVHAGVRYRATWTENEPWDPDDRSHRAWRASSGIEVHKIPFLKAVSLDVELEWRRFTSSDPADRDHFGRRDFGGEAQVEIVRGLTGSLDWISRAARRWRDSNFAEPIFDEEGVFEEAVFHTGVLWAWDPS